MHVGCCKVRQGALSVFTVPGGAAPWHGLPLLSYASSSPSPLLLASTSRAPALRPISAAQTVAIPAAQHPYQPNPTSTPLLRSHSHSAPSSSLSVAALERKVHSRRLRPPNHPARLHRPAPSRRLLRFYAFTVTFSSFYIVIGAACSRPCVASRTSGAVRFGDQQGSRSTAVSETAFTAWPASSQLCSHHTRRHDTL